MKEKEGGQEKDAKKLMPGELSRAWKRIISPAQAGGRCTAGEDGPEPKI